MIHVSAPEVGLETLKQSLFSLVLGHLEGGSELPSSCAPGISSIGMDGH